MKKLVLAILMGLVANTAFAMPDTVENRVQEADRYLLVTPPKEMIRDLAEQSALNLPPEKRDKFKNLLTTHLDMDVLTNLMKEAMVKHFTADELAALADFYGSTNGKSAMKKFGKYFAELMPAIQAEMIKAIAKSNRELSASE